MGCQKLSTIDLIRIGCKAVFSKLSSFGNFLPDAGPRLQEVGIYWRRRRGMERLCGSHNKLPGPKIRSNGTVYIDYQRSNI